LANIFALSPGLDASYVRLNSYYMFQILRIPLQVFLIKSEQELTIFTLLRDFLTASFTLCLTRLRRGSSYSPFGGSLNSRVSPLQLQVEHCYPIFLII